MPLPPQDTFNPAETEATPPNAVFDASVLGDMFNHDAKVIGGVLQTFVTATSASLSELAQAAGANDWASVASVAHRIAGASRLSGALALGQLAGALEQATKRGDVTTAAQALPELLIQWQLVQQAIGALPAD